MLGEIKFGCETFAHLAKPPHFVHFPPYRFLHKNAHLHQLLLAMKVQGPPGRKHPQPTVPVDSLKTGRCNRYFDIKSASNGNLNLRLDWWKVFPMSNFENFNDLENTCRI